MVLTEKGLVKVLEKVIRLLFTGGLEIYKEVCVELEEEVNRMGGFGEIDRSTG